MPWQREAPSSSPIDLAKVSRQKPELGFRTYTKNGHDVWETLRPQAKYNNLQLRKFETGKKQKMNK